MKRPNALLLQDDGMGGIEVRGVENQPDAKHGSYEQCGQEQVGEIDDVGKHFDLLLRERKA
jgi:hypothetical protein